MLTLSYRDAQGVIQGWRHVHNEFLQTALEQGVIGLSLKLWVLVSWFRAAWRARGDALMACFAAIGAAFLSNATVGFPEHLWVLGVFGLLSYCGGIVLSDRETRSRLLRNRL